MLGSPLPFPPLFPLPLSPLLPLPPTKPSSFLSSYSSPLYSMGLRFLAASRASNASATHWEISLSSASRVIVAPDHVVGIVLHHKNVR
ncbi:hypothetical protein Tco_0016481 [Tanacetum coccineum]